MFWSCTLIIVRGFESTVATQLWGPFKRIQRTQNYVYKHMYALQFVDMIDSDSHYEMLKSQLGTKILFPFQTDSMHNVGLINSNIS